jgi:asparagine synthase (glutamine-hydrolysing)
VSGFFGLLRPDGQAVDQRWLSHLAAKLSFRGPDGTNIQAQDGWGCSFAFLQTDPGRQSPQQPVTLDGRFFLLGHVRLDARGDMLRKLSGSLRAIAHDPTDEELLLLAWQQWGESSLEHLLGDFSFAVWDVKEKRLWCARDFIGGHPFFYAHVAGVFGFSNTLKILQEVPEISREFDEPFLGDFLLDGLSADFTRTVYRDIRRLAPGHLLKFESGRVRVDQFLRLPIEEPLQLRHPAEYIEAYRDLLQQAVRDRIPDAAVSLYLSGGLDSGSVCATAAQLALQRGQGARLKAFTFSWRPLFDDPEPEFAALTAKHLGLGHEVLEDAAFIPYDPLVAAAAPSPEPDSEPFLARAGRLSQRVAPHARVVLSGDGGDNVLTGQAWPYLLYLQKQGDWATIARTFGGFFFTHGKIPPLRGGFRTRFLRRLKKRDEWEGYPTWIIEDFERRVQLKDRWRQRKIAPDYEHPIHPQAYTGLHTTFWASDLEGEDAARIGVPLETRAPLLDLRILKFLLRLPPVPWCVNKELLRKAMKGRLPQTVLQRPKTVLLMDPLEACQKRRAWAPSASQAPNGILPYVNWTKYIETLEQLKGSLNGEILCPMVLAQWLKDIENAGGIQ